MNIQNIKDQTFVEFVVGFGMHWNCGVNRTIKKKD